MILINSLWANWVWYSGFLLKFSLWDLISKLAPFSNDGKRELCHFLFCQLLAKKKLNKSGNQAWSKCPIPLRVSQAAVLWYTPFLKMNQSVLPQLASSTGPDEQFSKMLPMSLTVALSLVSSPLAARTDNSCPLALLRAWTGIRKARSKIRAWWALHTQQVVSVVIRTGPHLHHTCCRDHSSWPLALWTPLVWLGLLSFTFLGFSLPHSLNHIRVYKEEDSSLVYSHKVLQDRQEQSRSGCEALWPTSLIRNFSSRSLR